MKIWHDDERPIPDESWTLARTNAEALDLLRNNGVSEISCDYVLADFMESGLTLTRDMIAEALVPSIVTFHTSSYTGAQECIKELADAGYTAHHEPLPVHGT